MYHPDGVKAYPDGVKVSQILRLLKLRRKSIATYMLVVNSDVK